MGQRNSTATTSTQAASRFIGRSKEEQGAVTPRKEHMHAHGEVPLPPGPRPASQREPPPSAEAPSPAIEGPEPATVMRPMQAASCDVGFLDDNGKEEEGMHASCMAALPPDLLRHCLVEAGAWRVRVRGGKHASGAAHGPWGVCREWRDALWMDASWPDVLSRAMAQMSGADEALQRAARLRPGGRTIEPCALLRAMVRHAHADAGNGEVLMDAAARGQAEAVRILLQAPEHAPKANMRGGWALVHAARGGHEAVVRLLLTWPEHAPRADCLDGGAMRSAAANGHEGIVRLLLEWPQHAPRADVRGGLALQRAREGGHAKVVEVLEAAQAKLKAADTVPQVGTERTRVRGVGVR